ncbi:MAG TPA: hypothetical protein VIL74_20705 [Pyrinomonadaceae bacterium]|jgi:hypothetical protein
MNEKIEFLKQLISILGNVTLAEAVTWAEVEENARALRAEGHEGETDENGIS